MMYQFSKMRKDLLQFSYIQSKCDAANGSDWISSFNLISSFVHLGIEVKVQIDTQKGHLVKLIFSPFCLLFTCGKSLEFIIPCDWVEKSTFIMWHIYDWLLDIWFVCYSVFSKALSRLSISSKIQFTLHSIYWIKSILVHILLCYALNDIFTVKKKTDNENFHKYFL